MWIGRKPRTSRGAKRWVESEELMSRGWGSVVTGEAVDEMVKEACDGDCGDVVTITLT